MRRSLYYFAYYNVCKNGSAIKKQTDLLTARQSKVNNKFGNNTYINSYKYFYGITTLYSSKLQECCWNCSSEEISEKMFCRLCGKIQEPSTKCHFAIFGIPVSFSINAKKLTASFRQLQKVYHPDQYAIKSEKELGYASRHSSAINKAYEILLSPVKRGEYILELTGHPLVEDDIDVESNFLSDILLLNEELADADSVEKVKSIKNKTNIIMQDILRKADDLFSQENYVGAKHNVVKLKYYENICMKIREYERSHGIVD